MPSMTTFSSCFIIYKQLCVLNVSRHHYDSTQSYLYKANTSPENNNTEITKVKDEFVCHLLNSMEDEKKETIKS